MVPWTSRDILFTMIARKIKDRERKKENLVAFPVFDSDGDSYINAAELCHMIVRDSDTNSVRIQASYWPALSSSRMYPGRTLASPGC